MMKNSHGLDVSYFESKLKLVVRDISNYTPDELARELARLSSTADQNVLAEKEFSGTTISQQAARIAELEAIISDIITDQCDREGPEDYPKTAADQSCPLIAAAMTALEAVK